MMTKEDFVFSIGFQGDVAIVDGKALKQNRGLNALQLAEKGLFRSAFCMAIFDNNEEDMNNIVKLFNENSNSNIKDIAAMKRTLGVNNVPEKIKKSTIIN